MSTLWRPTALLVTIALLAGGLIAVPSFAQPEEAYHYVIEPVADAFVEPAAPAAPAAAPAAALDQAKNQRQFLPLLRRGPEFVVLFGSTANPETFEVTQPGISFPRGITRLYVDARLIGIQGNRFRTEPIFPDGTRLRDVNVTATRVTEIDRYYLCRVPITQGRCGANEQPLLPGVYTVDVFLNDVAVISPQAEIR